MDEMKLKGVFTEANLEFQGKILERSGLGDETGLSDGIAAMKDGELTTSLRAGIVAPDPPSPAMRMRTEGPVHASPQTWLQLVRCAMDMPAAASPGDWGSANSGDAMWHAESCGGLMVGC